MGDIPPECWAWKLCVWFGMNYTKRVLFVIPRAIGSWLWLEESIHTVSSVRLWCVFTQRASDIFALTLQRPRSFRVWNTGPISWFPWSVAFGGLFDSWVHILWTTPAFVSLKPDIPSTFECFRQVSPANVVDRVVCVIIKLLRVFVQAEHLDFVGTFAISRVRARRKLLVLLELSKTKILRVSLDRTCQSPQKSLSFSPHWCDLLLVCRMYSWSTQPATAGWKTYSKPNSNWTSVCS